METTGSAVELEHVAKRYGVRRPWVLREVNLAVAGGSVIELAGANGAGKSTLLRILAGATLPSSGHRRIEPDGALGYMPERLTAPAFSAGEYLRRHVQLRRLDLRDGRNQVSELAERLQAGGLLAERMAALSKGSLQKVAAIQCLLGSPKVLVLDEPFSGLDAPAREALLTLLEQRVRAGTAIVFCDHHQRLGRRADRRVVLRDGRLSEESTAGDGAGSGSGSDHLRLVIAPDASDQQLARLLAEGWHIVSVREHPAGRVQIDASRVDPAR